jgi:hypothetical protein
VVMRGHGLVSLASPEEPVLGTQWGDPVWVGHSQYVII